MGSGRVSYTLTANLWSGDESVAACSEEINLAPFGGQKPPTCTQDFPGEYRTVVTRIERSLFRKTGNALKVQAIEPVPIRIAEDEDYVGTVPGFRIVCIQRNPPTLPRIDNCEVKMRLKAKTVLSLVSLTRQPTGEQVKRLNVLSEIIDLYSAQTKEPYLSGWELVNDLQEDTERGTQIQDGPCTLTDKGKDLEGHAASSHCQYEIAFSLGLWQKYCRCLAPTFSSQLMSRRYSILAVVTLRGSFTHTFRLEIPVQVCAQPSISDETEDGGMIDSVSPLVSP